eukprot:1114945-Pleurochrysis_carterae.AAC.1
MRRVLRVAFVRLNTGCPVEEEAHDGQRASQHSLRGHGLVHSSHRHHLEISIRRCWRPQGRGRWLLRR